ncbi:MAG TPA: 4-hydroxy-tetrahydrodipicolinate synthase [Phycisphaerae bacterium]|nr:4-hydroxy-tetrahydrodipicolinate synthase [Phycisphaerae bacterium]HOI55972.1 4-hydroxy-tetrahydrodipicolinate synthase [Phycisphaerae bacterium]
MFQGSLVAMVTPFNGERVDFDRIRELVDWHIDQGTDGLVPMGTTGESPTVMVEDHEKVIETVVKQAAGRVPVIAGTGGNSTAEALELTRFARSVGADATLQVCPYYNKPTQEGLYRHFAAIAEQVDLPMVLYNVPGRTAVSMAPQTVARLAQLKNVVAIKEASGSMDQTSEILSLCDITVLSGDDSLTLPLMAIGAKGVISVVANIVPADVHQLTVAALKGDFAAALQMHRKLFPLCRAMFFETNPIPVKTACGILKLCSPELRLPLCEMSSDARKKMEQAMKEYGLI